MILPQIGIFGIKKDEEDAFLASLLTGDPALLIGKQGTGKTGLVEAIGNALREYSKKLKLEDPNHKLFTFRIYDSSKLNFEDLVGFPNPKAMQEGKMDFIQSKTTAWDADWICFDEYNRQEPARQNNIFELQRSRRLMGLPTGTKWITNCMNPFGMAGTEELDDALVDRNLWFIHIPSFVELVDSAKLSITRHTSGSDGPGLRHWTDKVFDWDVKDDSNKYNERFAAAGEAITKLMKIAAKKYQEIEKEVGHNYATFVHRYICLLSSEMQNKEWKVELSGRRAGMIYRGLMSFRAIDLAKVEIDPHHEIRPLKDCFKSVLKMTIPVGISMATAEMNNTASANIAAQVDVFGDFFKDEGKDSAKTSIDVIYELLTTQNFNRKIEILMNELKDEVAKNQVWSQIIKSNKDIKTAEGQRNVITIGIVAHLMTVKPGCIPQALQSLIASEGKTILSLDKINTAAVIRGPLSNFEVEIKKAIEERSNTFSKLQAKMMFEAVAEQYRHQEDVSNAEFKAIVAKIDNDCVVLEKTILDKGLLVKV
jgi:energy-coupling factor transporter ATP-binding protein EcfA2